MLMLMVFMQSKFLPARRRGRKREWSLTTTARIALVGAIVIILIYVVCYRQCGCSRFSSIAHSPRCPPSERYPSHIQTQSHLILNPHRFIANYPATRQWSIAAKFMDTNFGNKMPLGGRTFRFPFSWYLSVPNPLSPSPFSLASALKSGSTSIFDFVIVSHCLVGALLMVISWNKWGDNWKWTQ